MRHCTRLAPTIPDDELDVKTFMELHDIPLVMEHERLQRLFESHGCRVLFVESAAIGHLWTIAVHLDGHGPVRCTSRAQSKEISLFLRECGVRLDPRSPTLTRHDTEIRIHFNHESGDPGVGRRYLRWRRGELHKSFATYDVPPGW